MKKNGSTRIPSQILPLTSLLIGVGVLFGFVLKFLGMQYEFIERYPGLNIFGENCSYAIGKWQVDDTFEKILSRDHDFTKMAMPYRAKAEKPFVNKGGYLYTKCQVDLTGLKNADFAWMNLGRIFGKSAIYLNGTLRFLQSDDEIAEFSILPTDKLREANLAIISKRQDDTILPEVGARTLLPFFFTDNRTSLEFNRYYKFFFLLEKPIFFMAFYSALLLIFAVCWLLGIKYHDVRWMIVSLSFFVLRSALLYSPVAHTGIYYDAFSTIASFGALLSLIAFYYYFLRLDRPKIPWDHVFWIGVVCYSAVHFYLLAYKAEFRNYTDIYFPSFISGILFIAISYVGITLAPALQGKRRFRIRLFSVTGVLSGGLCFVQGFFAITHAIHFQHFIDLFMVGIFAIFLASDLVVFHRQYFLEKARRMEEEAEKAVLAERLRLGRSIAELLLPKQMEGEIGSYQYQFFYQPANEMSGDWIQHWKFRGGEHCIFIGDVVGKGPSAALPVSTTSYIINECSRQSDSVENTIHKINKGLKNLFGGQIVTTLSVAHFYNDLTAEIWSFGSNGWVIIGEGSNIRFVNPRSRIILGLIDDIEIVSTRVKLNKNDQLFTFTDGVLEGSRGFRDLKREFSKDFMKNLLPKDLYQVVTKIGSKYVGSDDKTFAVVSVG